MIRLNIKEETLQNTEELKKIVQNVFRIKMVSSKEQEKLDNCFDYYNGKLPIANVIDDDNYEPKTFNLVKPIIDISTKTFIGVLPDIITVGKKAEKDKIAVFNQKLYNRFFNKEIFQTAKDSSICGTGFLCAYYEDGDTFPRFKQMNPKFSDVVYDCSLSMKKLFGFYISTFNEISNGVNTTKYVVYVYTKDKIITFISTNVSSVNQAVGSVELKDLQFVPYTLFSNGKNEMQHFFNQVPIFEFPNNAELLGDAECVFNLISLYNDVQNNRAFNIKQVVDYVLMLKNVRIGDEKEQAKMVNLLKKHRLLPVEGENVDAKYLTSPLNQTEAETLAKSIKDNIHYICRVPDLSSVDFSQNASDPILKIKTKPLIDLCNEKELSFTKPYIELIDMILTWCKQFDKKDYETYNFDTSLISLEFAHPLPSNDLDIITQISNLHNAGCLPVDMALQQISWVKSVSEAKKQIKAENDSIDKRKMLINNSNVKANETNLERQNSKIVSTGELDNKRNGVKGMGDKISDNDVE